MVCLTNLKQLKQSKSEGAKWQFFLFSPTLRFSLTILLCDHAVHVPKCHSVAIHNASGKEKDPKHAKDYLLLVMLLYLYSERGGGALEPGTLDVFVSFYCSDYGTPILHVNKSKRSSPSPPPPHHTPTVLNVKGFWLGHN